MSCLGTLPGRPDLLTALPGILPATPAPPRSSPHAACAARASHRTPSPPGWDWLAQGEMFLQTSRDHPTASTLGFSSANKTHREDTSLVGQSRGKIVPGRMWAVTNQNPVPTKTTRLRRSRGHESAEKLVWAQPLVNHDAPPSPGAPTGLQSRVAAQGLPHPLPPPFPSAGVRPETWPGAVPASSARSARLSTALPTVVTCMTNSALTSSQALSGYTQPHTQVHTQPHT